MRMRWLMPGSAALLLVAATCGNDCDGDDGMAGSGGAPGGTACEPGTTMTAPAARAAGAASSAWRRLPGRLRMPESAARHRRTPDGRRLGPRRRDAGGNVPPPMDAAAPATPRSPMPDRLTRTATTTWTTMATATTTAPTPIARGEPASRPRRRTGSGRRCCTSVPARRPRAAAATRTRPRAEARGSRPPPRSARPAPVRPPRPAARAS